MTIACRAAAGFEDWRIGGLDTGGRSREGSDPTDRTDPADFSLTAYRLPQTSAKPARSPNGETRRRMSKLNRHGALDSW